MALIITILKTLGALWPFLKEMIIKNTSLTEAVKTNKLLTSMFIALVFSLLVCYYLANLTVSEVGEVQAWMRKTEQLEKDLEQSEIQNLELETRLENRQQDIARLRANNDWLVEANNSLSDDIEEFDARRDRYLALIDQLQDRKDSPKQEPVIVPQNTETPSRPTPSTIRDRLEWLRAQEEN